MLVCDIPDSPEESFFKGQVYNCVKDSITQSSNPFRHMAEFLKVYNDNGKNLDVILFTTDGGTDRRTNLLSVSACYIALSMYFVLLLKVSLRMIIVYYCHGFICVVALYYY